MLNELRVESLLLIESATLRFSSGLNVITGETGAGKTVLAHAVDLLLGGKPRAGIVRPGAAEAYVEGIFSVPAHMREDPLFRDQFELSPGEADEIVLGRRVSSEGRTRAYVQGRTASSKDLGEIGSRLLLFYGQHEHRKLMLTSAQLAALDAFCGADHLDVLEEFRRAYATRRRLEGELGELRALAERRDREIDLLSYELEEIERAKPSLEAERELEAERGRLGNVEVLRGAALTAAESLSSGGAGGDSAFELMARAEQVLDPAAGLDEHLGKLSERFRVLMYEVEDLAREMRIYGDGLEGDPQRLEEVEERLEILTHLKRKHGGSIKTVLEHAERCRIDYERLTEAIVELERVEVEYGEVAGEVDRMAKLLSSRRGKTAKALGAAVEKQLAELGMEKAAFEVRVDRQAGEDRISSTGADSIEFLIAPNPGVPAGPIKEIASGGELSRVMLAILGVAQAGRDTATILFDEIDAGIGGTTARAVGGKLRRLADGEGEGGAFTTGAGRQVICITHLPQIASLADRHFRIFKESSGEVTQASVERIEKGEVVAELCRMLGADVSDAGARKHARELLAAA